MSVVVITTKTSRCRCDKCGRTGPLVPGGDDAAAKLAETAAEGKGWQTRMVRSRTKTGRRTRHLEWTVLNLCPRCKKDKDFDGEKPKAESGSTV